MTAKLDPSLWCLRVDAAEQADWAAAEIAISQAPALGQANLHPARTTDGHPSSDTRSDRPVFVDWLEASVARPVRLTSEAATAMENGHAPASGTPAEARRTDDLEDCNEHRHVHPKMEQGKIQSAIKNNVEGLGNAKQITATWDPKSPIGNLEKSTTILHSKLILNAVAAIPSPSLVPSECHQAPKCWLWRRE